MTTRRNRLINRKDAVGGGPPSGKTRNLTLRELTEHRVLVPPELAETGMSLIILVGLDGRLNPGLVNSNEVPNLKPIQDLNRLQRARAVVSSLDAASSKTSVVTEVKEQVISAALSVSIDPKKIELKLGAQSELIKMKTLSQNLVENFELYKACPQNKTAMYRNTATKWFDNSIKTLNDYVLQTQCMNGSKDISLTLLENHVPKWFYNKFTSNRVQELATNSIDDIFFPKKLSRMITFTEKEISSKPFIKESSDFSNQLDLLVKVVELYPSKEKDSILYPIPNDFSRRFHTFTDLPQIDRTVSQASILSLTIVHMVFCAIPLKAVTYENLQLHRHSLIYDQKENKQTYKGKGLDKFLAEASQNQPKHEQFTYIREMSTPLKVQYKDFINLEGQPKVVGFQFSQQLCQIFNITDVEYKAIAPGIAFDYQEGSEYRPLFETIFKKYDEGITKHSKRVEYQAAFSLLKPIQPKELNFGLPNSPLTKESEKFLKHISTVFHSIFYTNVKKYLQSFNNPVFQAQAVKIMHATLQARTVTLSEPPDESSIETEDDENPYTSVG